MKITGLRGLKLLLKSSVLLIVLLSFVGFPRPANADAVYTYSGHFFNSFVQSPFGLQPPSGADIDLQFTLAQPLGPNFSGAITPKSFIITDGGTLGLILFDTVISSSGCGSSQSLFSATNVNPCSPSDSFNFGTDSQGHITTWSISASWTFFLLSTTQTLDQSALFGQGAFDKATASIAGSPGTWSVTTTAEPSTVLLFSSGLFAVAGSLRRKLRW
jgi:hypothetical protein